MFVRRICFPAALATLPFFACSGKKVSELVPGVTTQIQIPKNLRAVRIDVAPQGLPQTCTWHSVDPKLSTVTLPGTLGIVPTDEGKLERLITVTITGYAAELDSIKPLRDCEPIATGNTYDSNVRILKRLRARYVGGRIVYLPMGLKYACYEDPAKSPAGARAIACGEGQTCIAGECVDLGDTPNMAQYPDFTEEFVNPKSSLCFQTPLCFQDQLPAKVLDENNCTYTFQAAPPQSGMNVRVYYDGGESEVLDGDDRAEGFTRSATDPKVFSLAPGMCKLVKAKSASGRRIIAVDVASACVPKTTLQPTCGGCGTSAEIPPVQSVAYILHDNGNSMRQAFGEKGIKTLLEFKLVDPAFRTTILGYHLLFPTGAGPTPACGDTALSASQTPFDYAPVTRSSVLPIVGNDVASVRADDPPLGLDSVLAPGAAYKAIRDLSQGSGPYNRKAVILIVRGGTGTEPTSINSCLGSAADRARDAYAADRTRTYVVALGGDDVPSMPTYDAIAAAGKTGAASNLTGPTRPQNAGAVFDTIVKDMGSCVYENTRNVVANRSEISYLDPRNASAGPSKVPFDASCSDANQDTANGWNTESLSGTEVVRICGAACNTLREALKATVATVPVFATTACDLK